MAKKKTFEEALNRLEEIADRIEENDVEIEEAVKLYKEGVELSMQCGEKLNRIEQEVMTLQRRADGSFSESKFDVAEEE